MIQGIPPGYALRLTDDGAPRLVKVEKQDTSRPGITMEQALQEKAILEQRASEDYQEASQWLRRLSDRQAIMASASVGPAGDNGTSPETRED